MEEKLKFLQENDVNVDDIVANIKTDEYMVVFENILDPGYSEANYTNTAEEAVDFAINQIESGLFVYYIQAN